MSALLVAALLLAVVVVHELGHVTVATMLGISWMPVLTRRGPGIQIGRDDLRLSRVQRGLTAAAGPAASLLLAACLWTSGQRLPAVASLEIAVANLLPFPHSDGRTVYVALHR